MGTSEPPPPTAPARLFQFGLIDLAEIVAGVALGVALVDEFRELGVAIAGVALLILGPLLYIFHARSRREAERNVFRIGSWLVFVVLMMCGAGMFLPAIGSGPPSIRRQCQWRLEEIGYALRQYHEFYGQLPPPYLADSGGRPMHSWRVLILPFLGHRQVYNQYRFDEPWNGPNNRKLADQVPFEYRCPADDDPPTICHYFYVTGRGRHRGNGGGLQLDEITDERSETILLVESHTLAVGWMEPRDLTLDEALQDINARPGPSIGSEHVSYQDGRPGRYLGGASVLMADGSPGYLPENLNDEPLTALLTIDGGEKVDFDDLRPLPPDYALLWLPLVTVTYVVAVAWRHGRLARARAVP